MYAHMQDLAQPGRRLQQKDPIDYRSKSDIVLCEKDKEGGLYYPNAGKSACLQLFFTVPAGLHHPQGQISDLQRRRVQPGTPHMEPWIHSR